MFGWVLQFFFFIEGGVDAIRILKKNLLEFKKSDYKFFFMYIQT